MLLRAAHHGGRSHPFFNNIQNSQRMASQVCLYTVEVSRQQDRLYHSIPAGVFLVSPLSPEDRPRSQESFYTSLNHSGPLCFLIITWLLSCFSSSCSPSFDLEITNLLSKLFVVRNINYINFIKIFLPVCI